MTIIIADYQKALEEGLVKVAYACGMLLGVGGVGKSSFLRGLKNLPLLDKANSTQVAEIEHFKETSSHMTRGEFAGDFLKPVTDDDEMNELVGLVRIVYNVTHEGATSSQVVEHKEGTPLIQTVINTAPDVVSTAQGIIDEVIKRVHQHPDIEASDSEIYLYMWDCGGQPVFLSVLQAFLTAKTLFMPMFNAKNNLQDRCLFVAHHNGVATEEYEEISTEKLLLKWMVCIEATLTPDDKSSSRVPHCPRILPIGTHGDDPKVKGKKEAILDQLFQEYKDKRCARLVHGKGYIVDNTTAGNGSGADPVYKQVLKEIHEFASSDAVKVDTPITWVLFRKVMKILAKEKDYPCFTMEEVVGIAQACKIPSSSVSSVLKFYHDLAVFLHYSDIPSLKSTVIADPHWLVKQMAKLLALKGFENVQHPQLWDILRSRGILVEELYSKIYKDLSLSPQAIVDLLDRFLIIAIIDTCGKVHHYKGKEYFVPSILPPLPSTDNLTTDTSSVVRAASLHIVFPKVRYLPPGFFTRLATTLSQQTEYSVAFGRGIYRNQVSFILGLPGAQVDLLTIFKCTYSVKLSIARQKTSELSLSRVCLNTIETVKKCCEQVCQWLPCITTGFGFHCDECGSAKPEHFILLNEDYTTESCVCCEEDMAHSWTPEQEYWLPGPKSSNLDMPSLHGQPQPAYKATAPYGQVPPLSPQPPAAHQASGHPETSPYGQVPPQPPAAHQFMELDHARIFEKLKPCHHEWRNIGIYLGFTDGELKNVQAAESPSGYFQEMISKWLQWAPGDARGSTDYATMTALKSAVDKAGYGCLSQEL